MARRALRWGHRCLFAALASLCLAGVAHGAALDEQGDINLGVRAYTAARIGTQDTDVTDLQPHRRQDRLRRLERRRIATAAARVVRSR